MALDAQTVSAMKSLIENQKCSMCDNAAFKPYGLKGFVCKQHLVLYKPAYNGAKYERIYKHPNFSAMPVD